MEERVLTIDDFNIHSNNQKVTLGLSFIDILNSAGLKQNVYTYKQP